MEPPNAHRSGPLKQQNKIHKHGKHKSKGDVDRSSKGKVSAMTSSRKRKAELSRKDRRNRADQLRSKKKEEAMNLKRNIGGERTAPHYIVLVSLCTDSSIDELMSVLCECDDSATVVKSDRNTVHVSYPKLRQRVAYLLPDMSNLAAVLDAVRAADTVLFVWSIENMIDERGEFIYSCLYSQGMPTTAHAVMGVKGIPHKKQAEVKKLINKEVEQRFTGGKIHLTDTQSDGILLVRFITQQKLKLSKSRQCRPHVIAEELNFTLQEESDSIGTLEVTGYVRGPPLSVDRIVHIPGYGDFQMIKITAPADPYPLIIRPDRVQDREMNDSCSEAAVLVQANPDQQENLKAENEPDPMEGEQTWPTEEELAEAAAAKNEPQKKVARVPKGTSAYQAAWIEHDIVSEDESSDADSDSADEMMEGFEPDECSDDEEDDEEMEDIETGSIAPSVTWADDVKYDQMIDADEEWAELKKIQQERENEMFPDEMDTPEDIPARERFARYRGLKSFRTSPWDPKENLPMDYSKIFQFENFPRFHKHILKEETDNTVIPGWYVTIHVKNVPKEVYEAYGDGLGCPLVLVGLLPNEQKMSVLNMVLKRHSSFSEPVKSKERLVFHCGFRRFVCNPVFSDHSNLGKHKYERFLPHEGVCVATAYAPIMFPPAHVLVFKESNGGHDLVASGSMLSVDPDRIITKRIVLSGHPYKINKRMAVIRYMFYNREDIDWFKPVELRTKWGRRGHIKEPLGTHGHMKCVFDNQLKSQDTVLLHLYKRVFPKWTYDSYVPPSNIGKSNEMDAELHKEYFN